MIPSPSTRRSFANKVLRWYDLHGRKQLPWQGGDPYRVWVSEIMLQQTQVATVIPYFARFMAAFGSIAALAAAAEDEVLHLWTGLGYYARARNLHRAAKIVVEQHAGALPADPDLLQQLPGIGRSTAGAIFASGFGGRGVILDGNVKRVLARHHAIAGWPGRSAVHNQLWDISEQLTPRRRVTDYNQAMMDLGATVCRRSNPDCGSCPIAASCRAFAQGQQSMYPGKKPRRPLPVKRAVFLIAQADNGEVFLQRRPARGIWGGLWCFPQLDSASQATDYCLDTWQQKPRKIQPLPAFRHSFSHYHLDIEPLRVQLHTTPQTIMAADTALWYNLHQPPAVGLAAPVSRLLAAL